MEQRATDAIGRELIAGVSDAEIERRLDFYLKANAATAAEKKLFPTQDDEIAARSMSRPLSPEKAFAYFGAMLGTLPPISFFLAFELSRKPQIAAFVIILMSVTTFVSAVTGYSFGKVIGVLVRKVETDGFAGRIAKLLLIGAMWGAVAGAAGGVFIFIIGAFFGAVLGAAVGAVAVPLFTLPYLTVKHGDRIDLRHFLPLSIGVTTIISMFILGSVFR